MSNNDIVLPTDPNDPEDRDVTFEQLEQGLRAREIRMARHRPGPVQAEFARRFRVPLGTLRDWEQARSMAPDFALAYVRAIARYPVLVAEALAS